MHADRRRAMSRDRILKEEARLREETEGLPARAGMVNDEEDARYEEEVQGGCIARRRCNAGTNVGRRSPAEQQIGPG